MKPVEYPIKPIKQRTSECMQTAATQLISYYDPAITLEEVLDKVHVYVENGEKIGTSPGHLASFFPVRGYKTTVYMFDVELFDTSWGKLTTGEIAKNLRKRQNHVPDNSWLAKYKEQIISGWEMYAKEGGEFKMEPLSFKLLYSLLAKGPFLSMVNSTYLNRNGRQIYDKQKDDFVPDTIRGRSLTHAVTCAGYKNHKFLIVDPDPPSGTGHKRWVPEDHFIASIMSAQTEIDNFLITISN